MAIQMFTRFGAALLLAALVAGCSFGRPGYSGGDGNCQAEPSQCRYEPGEREYAEREAARLNKAQADKLRRMR